MIFYFIFFEDTETYRVSINSILHEFIPLIVNLLSNSNTSLTVNCVIKVGIILIKSPPSLTVYGFKITSVKISLSSYSQHPAPNPSRKALQPCHGRFAPSSSRIGLGSDRPSLRRVGLASNSEVEHVY